MGLRIDLQQKLEEILGSRRVYFQPPENLKIEYPCIVYNLDRENPRYADDRPYTFDQSYSVTVIDRDPESPIPKRIRELPLCRFNRVFRTENLNHFVYTLYY